MQPAPLERSYEKNMNIQSVQIMRGIASLLVVLLHISIKGSQYGNGALKGFAIGGSGVDLFFIISGYIMCVSTVGRSLNFSQFMLLRIKRIIPLYWLVTTIALVVFLYNPKVVNTSGGETSIWASYALFPNGKKFLISNGWTLSYEFLFYLLFASFIYKGTYKTMQVSAIILLLLVAIGLCVDYYSPFFDFSTNILYLEFVFGMGCFYLLNQKNLRLTPGYGILLCLVGSVLLVLEAAVSIHGQEKWRGFYWGIPMLAIFIGLISLESLLQRNKSLLKSMLLEIGNSSYSLYLVHPFVLSGTAMALRRLKMANNPYLFTVLLLTLAIVIGHLVYFCVERPLMTLVRKGLAWQPFN